jgi:hypothetical protein
MRYYSVTITNPSTGKTILPSSLKGNIISSLDTAGKFNPQALNIEFDLAMPTFNAPDQDGWLRIWGLSLKDLGSAFDLNRMVVDLSVGMSKGLPLAKPDQQGLIMHGMIKAAYGNWIGVDQTLDMNFMADTGGPQVADNKNYPFVWRKGEELSTAIGRTLATALKGFKQDIRISKNLVLAYDESGFYQSAQQFNDYLNDRAKAILKKANYQSITISTDGSTVHVTDGTVSEGEKETTEIAFEDLIGQPTWIGTLEISFKTVLRGDLHVGNYVRLPRGPRQLTIASNSGFSQEQNPANKSTFEGKFYIKDVHHYGNFRQPDAESWNTTVIAAQSEPKNV